MSAKNYLRILRVGVIVSLLIFFFVFQGFLFPYITSKQLSFNILMEVLLIPWLILFIKYPGSRPRFSWITIGLLAYMTAIAVSCLTSINIMMSFWGNAERMLGFFHIFHFFLLYLYVITAFRKKEDWQWLFGASLLTGAAITVYGLVKAYPPSTIGNAAYVAGLMIFNIYFAIWLFFSTKNWGWRLGIIILGVLAFIGFMKADISGAQAGLGISVIAFLFFISIFSENKALKVSASAAGGLIVLAIILLFTFRQSPVFNSTSLGKALRDFSSENPTLNTRLISWKAAAADFNNHPWLGIGYGNYSIIFDKGFDAKFYDYSRSETYFDRAHNNLIDIASTTGIVGLITYLSIFVAIIYYLRRAWKNELIGSWQLSAISALLIGYFVQNLAVFDSLVTYVSLMFVLGYVYSCSSEIVDVDETPAIDVERERLWIALLLIVMTIVIYVLNGRAIMMYKSTIKGYVALGQGQAEEGYKLFKKAFDYNSGLERDSRVYFINMFLSYPSLLQNKDVELNKKLLDLAIEQGDINLSYNSKDSYLQLQMAQLFYLAARLNVDDRQEMANYVSWGFEAINIAIEASPRRVPLYLSKADFLILQGDNAGAFSTIDYAISLNPNYPDAYCRYAELKYYAKEYTDSYSYLSKCMENDGWQYPIIRSSAMVEGAIEASASSTPISRLNLFRALAITRQDGYAYAKLAQACLEAGLVDEAIGSAREAARLDSSLEDGAREFIESLGGEL